ncbi:hypothetical protein SARC_04847 [Sphaeroforma arctica JP610]|uniref:Ornithine decarboxylase n=1 Tax=Sphaeroforma arctica JP610 TaxID=667725 RepID=A0A0L0G162_9EUKA|nr:hypothetical protein SARC_04847 [Sphaeroforma arctica JP610]KNC82882.1 hypothetical protein SARC_04847 [Sphaeroforma arctica JP610]|eukprot:XP_014156784.1 hypothetical protein SARC_04847 [Sphaeroforma arctica JP610]
MVSRNVVDTVDTMEAREVTKREIMESIAEQAFPDNDPMYLIDVGEVIRKHRVWKELLPKVEPFYAMKCNPDPVIMKMLASSLNTGFDCASREEMQLAIELGVSPDRIIYANPCKAPSHLRYAKSVGVDLMTFDNEDELCKIKQVYPNARLVLRVLTDDSYSVCRLGVKFGADPRRVFCLLQTAKEMDLDVVGISFHVGSGCYNSDAFLDALRVARAGFDAGAEMGFNFTLLDIGGGFPGTDDAVISFAEICSVLTDGFARYFPQEKFAHVRIIAEPGRYYVAASHSLAVNVFARRQIQGDSDSDLRLEREDSGVSGSSDIESGPNTANDTWHADRSDDENLTQSQAELAVKFMYYVNDSTYASFNSIINDHAIVVPQVLKKAEEPKSKHLSVLGSADDEQLYACSVWGPTCDGLDCINKEATLPRLAVGSWLRFDEMGAYTCAASSRFNGFQLAGKRYINTEVNTDALVDEVLTGLGLTPMEYVCDILTEGKVQAGAALCN